MPTHTKGSFKTKVKPSVRKVKTKTGTTKLVKVKASVRRIKPRVVKI